jgi:hypothetical protein
MNSRELFKKIFDAHIKFEETCNQMQAFGINMDKSAFVDTFYTICDAAMEQVFTEEGLIIFYEDYIFNDYITEDVVEALDKYFL